MTEREQTIPPAFKVNKPPRSFAELVTYDNRLRAVLSQRTALLGRISSNEDLAALRSGTKKFDDDEYRRLGIGVIFVEPSIGRLRLAIVDTHEKKIERRKRDLLQVADLVRRGLPDTYRQRMDIASQLANLETLPQKDPVLAEAIAYSESLKRKPQEIKPQPTGEEEISEEEKLKRELLEGPLDENRIRQLSKERFKITIFGEEVEFIGIMSSRLFYALAKAEENRMPLTELVAKGYGEVNEQNFKKARSLIGMLNREERQGARNNLEIVIVGRGEQAEVYLKRLTKPAPPEAPGIIVPDLGNLGCHQLPPAPLEEKEYLDLINHPKIKDRLRNLEGPTEELFRRLLQNGESLTRIGNAIVKYRSLSPAPAIENLDVLLEQALFEEFASLAYAQTYVRDNMRLITPTQTFLLIANANPEREVTEEEETFGLLPKIEGFLSYPHGFLVTVEEDATEIRRVLRFENIDGQREYDSIPQANRQFNSPALVAASLGLEDPRAPKRLGVILARLNPAVPDEPLHVSPRTSTEYGVPENSHFDLATARRIKAPVTTDEIQRFAHDLTVAMKARTA